MANIKILLDTRRAKKDGTFNIIFRVTHSKQVYTINSSHSVFESQWNNDKLQVNKSHQNHKIINLKLSKDYFKIQEILINLGAEFTINKLRESLAAKPVLNNDNFKSFTEAIILKMMQNNKVGNALVYKTAMNSLIEFSGSKTGFKEIDYNFLERYTNYLASKGLKQNSIHNYFRTIRAIYNKAIKSKIVSRSLYPFYDISVKSETTIKRAILREDLVKLMNMHLEHNTQSYKSLKYFFLSFYLIGMSFTDLAYLKRENIIDGRVVYKRKKTHKLYSVKIFPEAEKIILSFKNDENDYLLPILNPDIPEESLRAKRTIQQWIKTTNKYLKRISIQAKLNGIVTTYASRHTFATTAKRLGYSNELIAEALGHQYGNKTTNIYLDSFDKEVVDRMHKEVIMI